MVDRELFDLIKLSLHFSEITDGAFDITYAVQQWASGAYDARNGLLISTNGGITRFGSSDMPHYPGSGHTNERPVLTVERCSALLAALRRFSRT